MSPPHSYIYFVVKTGMNRINRTGINRWNRKGVRRQRRPKEGGSAEPADL